MLTTAALIQPEYPLAAGDIAKQPADRAAEAPVLYRMHPGVAAAIQGASDYRSASATAGFLVNMLIAAGRLSEALEVVEQMAGYTVQAGLGPWTQLADQGLRLQILARMGEHERVLAEIAVLRDRMGELPVRPAGCGCGGRHRGCGV
jgi:hypothetical protein